MRLMKSRGLGRSSGLLATRQGNILVAAAVALIAGASVLVFLSNYRNSVEAEGQPAKVVVAVGVIQKGSAGELLGSERAIRVAEVRADQVKPGAVTDPALLRGKVAVQDVMPGQQILATDFAPADNTVRAHLRGNDRAVNVVIDNTHGMYGSVRTGDRVDVLVGLNGEEDGLTRPIVKLLMRDVLVLRAGGQINSDGSAGQGVILRIPNKDVAKIAYASDNAKIWLVMRPGNGVREMPSAAASAETLLFDRPVKLDTGGD